MRKYIAWFFSLLVVIEGADERADVVGGVGAKLKELPYQVSLQKFDNHFCGGSILNARHVLTAAHCQEAFNIFTSFGVSANAGMIDVRRPRQKHYMQRFVAHEKYEESFFYRYDIALVKLWTGFNFDSFIQPIKLPRPGLQVAGGSAVLLSGWGSLGGKDNNLPTILQKVPLEVVDQKQCKAIVEKNKRDHLYDSNLCAYNPQVRKGQCSGDSGGPLMFGGVQVGIVSWSDKDPYCASTKTPGVYTRVSEYRDWIAQHSRFGFF